MCEITWGGYIALPPSCYQHCTDEAQKVETVLSAVSYIHIYIYIYICMYVCIYVCMYVLIYICIYTYLYTLACICNFNVKSTVTQSLID